MFPRLESKDGGGGLSTTVMVAKLCVLYHSIYFLLVKYGAAHRIVALEQFIWPIYRSQVEWPGGFSDRKRERRWDDLQCQRMMYTAVQCITTAKV